MNIRIDLFDPAGLESHTLCTHTNSGKPAYLKILSLIKRHRARFVKNRISV